MNYRFDKYNSQISLLGFGCMRFQKTMGKIDMSNGWWIPTTGNSARFHIITWMNIPRLAAGGNLRTVRYEYYGNACG